MQSGTVGSSPQSQEQLMFLQRPSSGKSQDVRHVLSRSFRELLQRDIVTPDTVRNLTRSRAGHDDFHERYVDQLQRVYAERERRMAEAAMLERHIMQAQARATSADERALRRAAEGCDDYEKLGLPPVPSNFGSILDAKLLRRHKLITPADYVNDPLPRVPPPRGDQEPDYARGTRSSESRRGRRTDTALTQSAIASGLEPEFEQDLELEGSSRMSSPELEIQAAEEADMVKEPRLWEVQPPVDRRMQDRTDVSRLQKKVAYLENPRHSTAASSTRSLVKFRRKRAKEAMIKQSPEPPPPPAPVLLACPEVVDFGDYNVGQIYELRLELKNISSVLQQVRLIPPGTSHFAVGLGQFPGETGMIAPGMSCVYPIRFAPDSLSDYLDCVTVETKNAQPITVQLVGRRPPPVLTLPNTLNVGECIVGGKKVAQFIVRNHGGHGRFAIVPRSAWPTSNFKTNVTPSQVSVAPFELRPAVFELAPGATTMLEVIFSPGLVEQYTEHITLLSDNCNLQHLTLTGGGVIARVELSSVEGDITERLPGESRDATASALIRFEDLNPYTFVQRKFCVKNPVNLELSYNWKMCKPVITRALPDGAEDETDDCEKPREMIVDFDSSFSVTPVSGVLPPSGETEFEVTFAPPELSAFHSVMHMVLQNIPQPVPEPPPTDAMTRAASQESLSGSRSSLATSKSSLNQEPTLIDVTGLELELKGRCVPLEVSLDPYAILIPGHVTLSSTVRRPFRMINSSMCIIAFQWQSVSSGHIVQIEPPFGELPPGLAVEQELILTATEIGPLDLTLLCYIEHMQEPLKLRLQANIKGPEVTFDQPDLNFGLMRLGETVTRTISIYNSSQIAADVSLSELSEFDGVAGSTSTVNTSGTNTELQIEPAVCQLRPLETRQVHVTYTPKQTGRMHTVIGLSVQHGKPSVWYLTSSNLAVHADTQLPRACLRSCQLTPEEIYCGVPTQHKAHLINQTAIETSFAWQPPIGDDAEDCEIEVIPQCGLLYAREELEVIVNFTSNRVGEILDVVIPCKIESMEQPVCLSITCDTRPLSVTITTPEPGQDPSDAQPDDLVINFGNSVQVGANPVRVIHLQNNSAISAPFSVNAEYFFTRPPTPPEKKADFTQPTVSQRRQMLSKTPNLADPFSKSPNKTHSELCSVLLRDGKGAAFLVSPPVGELGPFASQTIEITAFSDMYGEYRDNIVVKIEGLTAQYIPVCMNAVGCPLLFQMTAPNPDQTAYLRFGSHVSGLRPITRNMRVNNTAPYDVRVDWEVNNVVKSEKLLDLTVFFGQAFPIRDENNEEIPPKIPDEPPATRPPTEFIPNTPDSSLAPSRLQKNPDDMTPDLDTTFEQPKIAHVVLKAHEGTPSEEVFQVKPKQMVVPARGHASVYFSFTPFTSEQDGEHRIGYANGYISLDNPMTQRPDNVVRCDGYDVSPLRLELTAHVKPPLLSVECLEEDGMEYRIPASNLLDSYGQPSKSCTRSCAVVLTNTTEAAIRFRLGTAVPFCLMALDPAPEEPLDDDHMIQESPEILLKPNSNIQVGVGFRATQQELSLSTRLEPGRSYEDLHVKCDVIGTERRLVFSDVMSVTFNNGTVQTIPLSGMILVPQFEANKDVLDFGVCLVNQTRQLHFVLTNRTSSASSWNVLIESASDNCKEDTFEIFPASGVLPAHVTHKSNSTVIVNVNFTASHSEEYEAVLVIQGAIGEASRRIHVSAIGSYDGKHEALAINT